MYILGAIAGVKAISMGWPSEILDVSLNEGK